MAVNDTQRCVGAIASPVERDPQCMTCQRFIEASAMTAQTRWMSVPIFGFGKACPKRLAMDHEASAA